MQLGDYSAIGMMLATIYLGFTSYIAKRRVEAVAAALEIENKKRDAQAAAVTAEAQKQTAIAISTHKLVNSQMGEQKRMLMVSAASLYAISPTEANQRAAEAARKDYEDHQLKQKAADEAVGTLDARTTT